MFSNFLWPSIDRPALYPHCHFNSTLIEVSTMVSLIPIIEEQTSFFSSLGSIILPPEVQEFVSNISSNISSSIASSIQDNSAEMGAGFSLEDVVKASELALDIYSKQGSISGMFSTLGAPSICSNRDTLEHQYCMAANARKGLAEWVVILAFVIIMMTVAMMAHFFYRAVMKAAKGSGVANVAVDNHANFNLMMSQRNGRGHALPQMMAPSSVDISPATSHQISIPQEELVRRIVRDTIVKINDRKAETDEFIV